MTDQIITGAPVLEIPEAVTETFDVVSEPDFQETEQSKNSVLERCRRGGAYDMIFYVSQYLMTEYRDQCRDPARAELAFEVGGEIINQANRLASVPIPQSKPDTDSPAEIKKRMK